MARISLDRRTSLVLVIDLQENFLKSIFEADRVLRRSRYLHRVAMALEIPTIITTQNAPRLGELSQVFPSVPSHDKVTFSCFKDATIRRKIEESGRRQIVLAGVETHICVGLTANDLLAEGYEVVVCPDAVSSSSLERHKLGMERIRDAGAVPVHTESVGYEWVGSCQDSNFKSLLSLTKESKD